MTLFDLELDGHMSESESEATIFPVRLRITALCRRSRKSKILERQF